MIARKLKQLVININLRNEYIPKYYSNMPSVLKFIKLVQTNTTSLLIKLSIYCI